MGLPAAAILLSSCGKFLDINQNPNKSTTENSPSPENILQQAITYTASNISAFNTYGAEIGGYAANAGGYGGFGSNVTYQFSTEDFAGLWTDSYNSLEDYQAIIDQTVGDSSYNYFHAASLIMKVFTMQLLVDTYNDVPYSQALTGDKYLTPVYDKAEDIYKDLALTLDTAINLINTAQSAADIASSDILFNGDMTKWKQFANTIKLRLILRGGDKVSFANKTFSDDGFLQQDAIVNPGYVRDNGKQNPKWNSWAYTYTGGAGNAAWIPTKFILAYFNGTKLQDPVRGKASFYKFPDVAVNQLGNGTSDVPKSPTGTPWYSGSDRDGSSAGASIGILKGPDMGMPLMLAAESYFLQAEGALKGLVGTTSEAKEDFEKGIKASFNYLYTLPSGNLASGTDVNSYFQTYQSDNKNSYLVNFDLAKSSDEKLEAIITQKYIAVNFINSEEGWYEYRRTKYPKLNYVSGSKGATETFASIASASTLPDKLPARILYPNSEYSYNAPNVPGGITAFGKGIFWAK